MKKKALEQDTKITRDKKNRDIRIVLKLKEVNKHI